MSKSVRVLLVAAIAFSAMLFIGAANPASAEIKCDTPACLSLFENVRRPALCGPFAEGHLKLLSCSKLSDLIRGASNVTYPDDGHDEQWPPTVPVADASGNCPGQDDGPVYQADYWGREAAKLRAELAVICLVNYERSRQSEQDGISRRTLIFNADLREAARRMASDMAAHCMLDENHRGTDGSTIQQRATQAGYGGRALENGYAWWPNPTPRRAVNAWLASSGHFRTMMQSDWMATGVGVAHGSGLCGPANIFYYQYFGDSLT